MKPHEFISQFNLTQFVFAGTAIFILHNEETGNGFTFKVSKGKKRKDIFYVYALSPSNVYVFLGGYSNKEGYIRSNKSPINEDALPNKTVRWFFDRIVAGNFFQYRYKSIKAYHIGLCGRCGHPITTAESLKTGYGSTCLIKQVLEGKYISESRLASDIIMDDPTSDQPMTTEDKERAEKYYNNIIIQTKLFDEGN